MEYNYNLPYSFSWNPGQYMSNSAPFSGSTTPQSFPSTTLNSPVPFVPTQQPILPQLSANILGHNQTAAIQQPSAILSQTQPAIVQTPVVPQVPHVPAPQPAPAANGFNAANLSFTGGRYPNFGLMPLTNAAQNGTHNFSYQGNTSVTEGVPRLSMDKVENVREMKESKDVEQQVAQRMSSLLSNPQILRSILLQGSDETILPAKKEYINMDNMFTDVNVNKIESADQIKSLKGPLSIVSQDLISANSSDAIAKIVQATLEAASLKSSPTAVPTSAITAAINAHPISAPATALDATKPTMTATATATASNLTTDMAGLFQDDMDLSNAVA